MKPLDYSPPHDLAAERAALGCVMLAPDDKSYGLLKWLKPEHFYDLRHESLRKSMVWLRDHGKSLHFVAVDQRLRDECAAPEFRTEVQRFADCTAVWAHFDMHLEILRDRAWRRAALAGVEAIRVQIGDTAKTLDEVRQAMRGLMI